MITQKMIDAVTAEILERCKYACLTMYRLDTGQERTSAVDMTKQIGANGPEFTVTIQKATANNWIARKIALREQITGEDLYTENLNLAMSVSRTFTRKIKMDLEGGAYFQRLPEGYTRCEYLAGDGKQYIDTGYAYRTPDFEIECKYRKIENLSTCAFGVASSTTPKGMHGHIYKMAVYFGNGVWITGIAQSLNTDYSVKESYADTSKNLSVSLNGETITKNGDNGWAGTEWTDYLFAVNRQGTPDYMMAGRIYYHRMKNKNGIVRDFVPCLDEKGKPCMFDMVGRKAYYNLGDGEFGYKTVGYSISETLRQNVLTAIFNSCQHIYAKEMLSDGSERFREMLVDKKVELADGNVRVSFTFYGAHNGTIKAFYLMAQQGTDAANAVFAENVDIALSATGIGGPCAVCIDFGG